MSVTSAHLARRTVELLLLLAASPVVVLLFILAILNDGRPLDAYSLAVPVGLFVAFLASHLAVRFLAPQADPALLPLAFLLSGIGIAFVMRLDAQLAERQVLWLFLSIAAMLLVLIAVRSVRRLGDYKYTILVLGLVFLLLPAFVGTEHNGSRIWLNFAGFSFQPGELAKVLIVLFLAGYLADNREMLSASGRRLGALHIPDFRTLVPLVVMWGISFLVVVFERDLGSALLFFGLFVLMLYVATGRISFVVIAVILGVVGAVAAYYLFDHVRARVSIWIDPFAFSKTSGYQLVQALYSLADGSLVGTGIGRGNPTLIPIVESDFIFAAIAEEMGLLGAAGVLIAFMLLVVRGLAIASTARSDQEAFTAAGLTGALSLQAAVIVGGVTGLMPLTGVTLPFMSQGGSSLLASFVIVGLLLRVSNDAPGHAHELQTAISLSGGVLGRVALGKRLVTVVTCFCLVFAVCIGNLTWQMVVRAPEIRALPANSHRLIAETRIQRGAILSSDGVVLARSVDTEDGSYRREYPQGQLAAHVVGYSSVRYGLAGVEASQQETLRGESGFTSWSEAISSLAGAGVGGNDVTLTIDSRLQAKAEQVLAGHTGAAVLLDAETGEVLACASAPTYDINLVEELLAGEVAAASDGIEGTPGDAGTDAAGSALFNRATMGLYAPGSTFKIVTLTAALQRGGIKLTDSYNAPSSIDIGNAPVTNYEKQDYGRLSVKRAFEISSNTAFAQIAAQIGAAALVSTSRSFGFGQQVGQDFSVAVSLMPDPGVMTEWETAWAGAGMPVGSHRGSPPGPQATVVQMALVGSAFANQGVVMNPFVVAKTTAPNGTTLTRTAAQPLNTVASADVVASVNEAMAGVVAQGTGVQAQVSGHTVYGKTGTAETGDGKNNSWFVGHVNVGGRTVAVALVFEQAASGAATAPARQILEEAVAVYG
ncbi:MAG: FtsW/RodA/SpoVE family cell cycle protein [Coriobacteriales bacterium]|jgi:peptidoglycan glycosyltransferase|nr:FtsW/RodA/SpoVE family cell cycle protein [Coriobacteriales bacterium]